MRSGLFFTSNNILDILRAMIVPGMLGLAEYIVMISGGCDVSFPYVAALSMYSTIIILKAVNFTGNVIVAFLISCAFGTVLGLINGFIIMKYRFPVLIVTLGTCSICTGILFGILNAHEIPTMPEPIQKFAKVMLIKTYSQKAGMAGSLPIVFYCLQDWLFWYGSLCKKRQWEEVFLQLEEMSVLQKELVSK